MTQLKPTPLILIDAIFFQFYQTGIARVWESLFSEWNASEFSKNLIILDRGNTAPKYLNLTYYSIESYNYRETEKDRYYIQKLCDQLDADLFISTYYTTTIQTPSCVMIYDMIPEVFQADLSQPMWIQKHLSIQKSASFITISRHSADDLVRFFPKIKLESIQIAHCGVNNVFQLTDQKDVTKFRSKHKISKPYFLLVGAAVSGGVPYKNATLFFRSFATLSDQNSFEVICVGHGVQLSPAFQEYIDSSSVRLLNLSDQELAAAYSGAVALVFPSKYEGFGMPILEAMACGCPVITCRNSAIPEVAGEATLYVGEDDVEAMTQALIQVQKPIVRQRLIQAGLERAKQFSWTKMAEEVKSALIDATLLPLKLKSLNLIFLPDWSASEDRIQAILLNEIKRFMLEANHEQMTLLLYAGSEHQDQAESLLSEVTLVLLSETEELLQLEIEPTILVTGSLGDIQWDALRPRIQYRISTEIDDQDAIHRWALQDLPTW